MLSAERHGIVKEAFFRPILCYYHLAIKCIKSESRSCYLGIWDQNLGPVKMDPWYNTVTVPKLAGGIGPMEDVEISRGQRE